MTESRRLNFRRFLLLSLIVMFLLLALQAVTLYFFSGKTIRSETENTNATLIEQLNNNVDWKIKDAEYVFKLLGDYINTSPLLEEAFAPQSGAIEQISLLRTIAGELNGLKSYVPDTMQLLLLSEEHLFSTFANFPRTTVFDRKLQELLLYVESGQEEGGDYLTASRQEKRELLELIASAHPQEDSRWLEPLEAAVDNSIVIVSPLLNEAKKRAYLSVVLIPYNSLVQIGGGSARYPVAVMSGETAVYDPQGIVNGTAGAKIAASLSDRPSDSFHLFAGGKSYTVFTARNSYTDLSILMFVSKAMLNENLYRIGRQMAIVFLASLLVVGAVITLFWSYTVVVPVRKLLNAVRRNSTGILRPRFRASRLPFMQMSLKNKFIISYGLLLFLVSNVLTYYCYLQTRQAIEQSRYGLYELITENAALNMDSLFGNYRALSRYIALDRNVQTAAAAPNATVGAALDSVITRTLLSNPFNLSGLSNVTIYNVDGEPVYTLVKGSQLSGVRRLNRLIPNLHELNLYGYLYWSDTFRDSLNSNRFSIVREIRHLGADRPYGKIGFVNIEINEMVFNSLFNRFKHMNYDTLIVDLQDRIISAADKNYIGKPIDDYKANSADSGFVFETPVMNDWRLMVLVPRKDIENHVKSNLLFNLYVLVAFMIVIGIFLYMFYNRLVHPLLSLNSLIKGIRSDKNIEQKVIARVGGYDEVIELGENFNRLMDRINKLIHENYVIRLNESQLEIRKREVELNALQAQINPHFIYNTLDTINWMIMLNRSQDAVKMVSKFSLLLRSSLSKGQIAVPIEEELQHVSAYMDIQLQRYRKRLNFITDIDKALGQYKTLKLILQPIVENAVYHGTESKEGLLTVVLKGYVDNDKRIVFKVIDDGGGIHREDTEKLNLFQNIRSKGGIGLKNVHERIQLYCGPQYFIKIHSIHGAGTTVVLSLPLLKGDD